MVVALTLVSSPRGVPAEATEARRGPDVASLAVAEHPDPQQKGRRRRAAASSRARTTRPTRTSGGGPALPSYLGTRSAAALSAALGSLVGSGMNDPGWGAIVVSLTRGDTLFSVHPDKPLLPASTFKLYTTALALERFGPDHRLSTDVYRDGPLGADGTLQGNIIIRGAGDPAFSNRWVHGGGPGAPMDSLAGLVAAAGVKRVTGDVIGDATAFEDRRIPEGWLSRYLGAAYAAPFSALSINENVVVVATSPGSGGRAEVALQPASATTSVVNNVRTVQGGAGASLSIHRASDGHIEARGWIGSRSAPRYYLLVIDDPATFTTGAFKSALVAQGITVGGGTRLAKTPPSAVKLTGLQSPPIGAIIALMNRESINHYAELLFRDAAHAQGPDVVGSAETGNALLNRFITEKAGAPAGSVSASDGSGLSTLDRTTPRAQVHLLAYAHRAPWASAFHASLPVAGESELLRHRMIATPAQGNLHAKTGTTNDVVGLAGYVTAADGEVIAFSFLYNGRDRWSAKSKYDAMGATLAAFARP